MPRSFYLDGLYCEHAAPAGGQAVERAPLLLVHGAGHGAWCWEHWLEALPRKGWEAFALSLPNHPGSRTVYGQEFLADTRVDDYADDVARLAGHIARPAVVIGHSMGGIVAQRFVAREGAAGRDAAALVVLAAVPPAPQDPLRNPPLRHPPLRDAPLPLDRGYWSTPEESRRRYFHSAPEAVVERALARLVPESPSVMNEFSLGPGLAVNPRHVRCPVLSVTAGRDGTAVPKDRRIAEFYGGDFLTYPEAGHDLMLEADWETVLDDILAWIARKTGG